MIVQEMLPNDLVKTYSDQGMYIYGGFPEDYYEAAIDPVALHRTYVETDIPIEHDEDEAGAEDYEEALTRLGVDLS